MTGGDCVLPAARIRSAKRVRYAALGMLFVLLATATGSRAGAQAGDPRIQQVAYDPTVVYPLSVYNGFAAIVEFAPQESIDSVVIGNNEGWQITPTGSANRLVVKPLSGAAPTNLMVVTNLRRYVFFLAANGSAQDTFVLKFGYDGQTSDGEVARTSYRMSGSRALRPLTIADNGKDTRIVWDNAVTLPAVFGLDDDGHEMLLNGRMTPSGYLIEGVHDRLVFRLGKSSGSAKRILPRERR